jgi:hypothetical protein
MMFLRESHYLRDQAGNTILALMKEYGVFIAGGAVTSTFCSSRINDFDLFFPDETILQRALTSGFVQAAKKDDKTVETDSALSLMVNNHRLQLIKVVTGTPEAILDGFDFTICQGAFHLERGFIFGDDFFQHLAQRRLVFNINAGFPICSLYRSRKFIKRGFSLSGIEAIKLGLCIQSLKLETYKDLRRQLMGIDTLFLKDLTDSLKGEEERKFDLNEFLSTLDKWLVKLDTITGEGEQEA